MIVYSIYFLWTARKFDDLLVVRVMVNDEILTIQKGLPPFSPNFQYTDSINSNDLKQKLIDLDSFYSNIFNKNAWVSIAST